LQDRVTDHEGEIEQDYVVMLAVAQWLKHYATSWDFAGSRPDEVILFLDLSNSSSHTRPWGLLTSDRNEYQKQKNNVCGK
jgi:hypothetical protein